VNWGDVPSKIRINFSSPLHNTLIYNKNFDWNFARLKRHSSSPDQYNKFVVLNNLLTFFPLKRQIAGFQHDQK